MNELLEEKIAEKVVITLGFKGAKKIFGANAVDKSADRIIELLRDIGKKDPKQLWKYLQKGINIDKRYLEHIPFKKLRIKFES